MRPTRVLQGVLFVCAMALTSTSAAAEASQLVYESDTGSAQERLARARQALRAVAFGLAMIFWAPVFAPIYYALGSRRAAIMVACAALAILGSMLSMRVTKSAELTGNHQD